MDQKDLRRHAGLCRQAAVEQALLMAIQSPDMGSGADENGTGYKVCLLSPPPSPPSPPPPPLCLSQTFMLLYMLFLSLSVYECVIIHSNIILGVGIVCLSVCQCCMHLYMSFQSLFRT
jgi:hypothetical protein